MNVRLFVYSDSSYCLHVLARNGYVCHSTSQCGHRSVLAYLRNIGIQGLINNLSLGSGNRKIIRHIQLFTYLNYGNALVEKSRDRICYHFGNNNIITFKCFAFKTVIGKYSRICMKQHRTTDIKFFIRNKSEYSCYVESGNNIIVTGILFVSERCQRSILRNDITVHGFTAEQERYLALDIVHKHGFVKNKLNVLAHHACIDTLDERGKLGNHTHIDVNVSRRNIKLDTLHGIISVLFEDDLPFSCQNIPAIFTAISGNIGVRAFIISFGIPFHPISGFTVQIIYRCGNALYTIAIDTFKNISRRVDKIG